MQRTTITLDDDLMARLDEFMADRQYANRSEAIRDLVRAGLEQQALASSPQAQCLGAAIYVYDHEARDLSSRLTRAAHEHHDLSLATLHVHLDHDSCMEVTVLRGAVATCDISPTTSSPSAACATAASCWYRSRSASKRTRTGPVLCRTSTCTSAAADLK